MSTYKYRYRPLTSADSFIRLLRISKGPRLNDIYCELIDAELAKDSSFDYKALSYTWSGDEHIAGTSLFVGEQEVRVKESLFQALRHIRGEDEDVYLWVDAICINQDDDEEKGKQVSQMGRIYEYSEEVIVWLGGLASGVSNLFALINQLDALVKDNYTTRGKESWEDLCLKHMQVKWDYDAQAAFEELLQRPWFERAWIIQEVAMARRVIIQCGQYACNARTFALVPSILGIKIFPYAQAVLDIMPRLRAGTWWTSGRNLHSLLERFAGTKSTQKRDKIYALLGISEDASDPEKFFPCYKKSEEALFTDTALFMIFSKIPRIEYRLPSFTLEDLSSPLAQIEAKIIRWNLRDNGPRNRAACQRTVDAILSCLRQKDKDRMENLILFLARARGLEDRIHSLAASGSLLVEALFKTDDYGVKKNVLRISSSSPEEAVVDLNFSIKTELEELDPQRLRQMTKQILPHETVMAGHPLPPVPREARGMIPRGYRRSNQEVSNQELRTCMWLGENEKLRKLIDQGADVNGQDAEGWTPLHIAVARGNVGWVSLLIQEGADMLQEGPYGYKPFQFLSLEDNPYTERAMGLKGTLLLGR